MVKSIFIILIAIAFISCKKEDHSRWTEIDFEVQNIYTGEPEDAILFYVYGKRFKPTEKSHQVGENYPLNGKLHFEFKAKKGYEYTISEIDPQLRYCIVGVTGKPIEPGKVNQINYKVSPYAQLILTLENVNCFNSFDTLHWRLNYDSYPSYQINNPYWEDYGWNGCYPKEEAINAHYPVGDYSLDWVVCRENGDSLYGTENFYLPINGGLTFDFQY